MEPQLQSSWLCIWSLSNFLNISENWLNSLSTNPFASRGVLWYAYFRYGCLYPCFLTKQPPAVPTSVFLRRRQNSRLEGPRGYMGEVVSAGQVDPQRALPSLQPGLGSNLPFKKTFYLKLQSKYLVAYSRLPFTCKVGEWVVIIDSYRTSKLLTQPFTQRGSKTLKGSIGT